MILLGGAKGKARLHVPHRRRRHTSPPTISFHLARICALSHCTSAATLPEPSCLIRLQGVYCPRKTAENRVLVRQCQNKNLPPFGRSVRPARRPASQVQKKHSGAFPGAMIGRRPRPARTTNKISVRVFGRTPAVLRNNSEPAMKNTGDGVETTFRRKVDLPCYSAVFLLTLTADPPLLNLDAAPEKSCLARTSERSELAGFGG